MSPASSRFRLRPGFRPSGLTPFVIVISRLWLPALLSLGIARGSLGQFTAAEYAQRRSALLAQIPEGVVVALGAHEPPQDYLSFYQSPSFNYLTGLLEPDAALV
ncbi:MAG: hypothetical protein DMD26_15020, partial [Gemmatimonadetes bacterium]